MEMWGLTKWEAIKIADKLEASQKREKADRKMWLLVFAPKDNEAFFAKMKLLYDMELHYINKDLDKYGVHLPPPCQQRQPRTKNSTQRCQRMPLSCR